MTAAALVLVLAPAAAGARRPMAEPPPGCRPYSDAGDYSCAGLELRYHTSGSAAASSDIWAGQWLFTDDRGNFRLGSCTFNRGLHPRADDPAQPIQQAFPNDPGHGKSAYLTWRYGATTDHLTAAALWAIFHYYAQDPAGSARASDPRTPLVPSLDMLAAASGRSDLQQRAIEMDAEAARFSATFRMSAEVAGTTVTVRVVSNGNPVPGVSVAVGGDTLVTDASGAVTVEAAPGARVTASASIPGPPVVYLAPPLRPHAYGGQSLITAGPPRANETSARVPVPETTTTTTVPPTTSITVAPTTSTTTTSTTSTTTTSTSTTSTTTSTSTTSTTTSTTTPTTAAPTTEPTTTTPTTVAPTPPMTTPATSSSPPSVVVEVGPPPPPPPPPSTLPETGSTETIAGAAAVVLGAGVGALVGLRRRMHAAPAAADDIWG